ncbi:MAG: class I SAM-dependent methyltransferase [bacterium]|nr:class I SAM-dependent methyltransferase [bacterium]MDZ4231799.1 class I SAM-dependent methyltransferase [Candidatus Pacearchaeota archaeon]
MEYTSETYAKLNRDDQRHLQELEEFLRPLRGDKILEVGCGRGFIARELQKTVPHTYGVDVNPGAIKNGVALNLQIMDAEHLEFEDDSFDKIYSFHMIEHVPSPGKVIREMERVLRPGGEILLVYPAEPVRGLFSIISSIIIFKTPFKARKIHLHKLRPSDIQVLIRGTKLEHVESKFALLSTPQFFTHLQKRTS